MKEKLHRNYNEYLTEKYFDCDIDCAASEKNTKCSTFYSKEDSFLDLPYSYFPKYRRLWLNPPYSRKLIPKFVEKFMVLCKQYNNPGMMLLPTTVCSAFLF